MFDFFDVCRIDVLQRLSVLMDVQDMVIESFSFDKQFFKFFFLFLVQSFFDYFAFEDFADLVSTFKRSSQTGSLYRFPLGF